MGRRRGLGPEFTTDDGDDAGETGGAGETGEARSAIPPPSVGHGGTDHDRTWLPELRAALGCTAGLFALMLLVDLANGTLVPWRLLCWAAVALALFAMLCPPRVTAGEHWLASRGPVRTRRVHTDLLVSVRLCDGMAPRLVLRDAVGGRVELDPKVLTVNPVLWHRLDQGVRRSRERGLLRCGAAPLRALAERIDHDGARAVFEASGLE
ncbi:hypothetical protein [Streptomyces inhibens]|uniref:hypothetical protein n=1 Tax=Streptomyces inhibens TaxID=2293571 RepID=UPI001EE72609|nr:hypothetical protein [Streptomyces inhibens]UKY50123.1 hypothetical protein KI385_15695 [Streptomyces inhibens]